MTSIGAAPPWLSEQQQRLVPTQTSYDDQVVRK